jgi:hypothetical protein
LILFLKDINSNLNFVYDKRVVQDLPISKRAPSSYYKQKLHNKTIGKVNFRNWNYIADGITDKQASPSFKKELIQTSLQRYRPPLYRTKEKRIRNKPGRSFAKMNVFKTNLRYDFYRLLKFMLPDF